MCLLQLLFFFRKLSCDYQELFSDRVKGNFQEVSNVKESSENSEGDEEIEMSVAGIHFRSRR